MKPITTSIFCALLFFTIPLSFSQENQEGQTLEDVALTRPECKNKSKTNSDCIPCEELLKMSDVQKEEAIAACKVCPPEALARSSIIDNNGFEYHGQSVDFSISNTAEGCRECGSLGPAVGN
ncbi:MAG: hypothetical protein OXT67_10675, partial [Zetaproteobacteria bacterium]|nr:hypothetical protein [Zetaproteobacteria bacterium]